MLVYWKYLIGSENIGKEAVRAIAGTLLVNLIMGATECNEYHNRDIKDV